MRTFSKSVVSKIFFGLVTIFNLGLAVNSVKDLNIENKVETFSAEGLVNCLTSEGVRWACGTSNVTCGGVKKCE